MHDDETIGRVLTMAILGCCGDYPSPFGVTDYPVQAEWSRILMSCRDDLRRKVISRLESPGLQTAGVSEGQMRESAHAVVQEGLELLQRPTRDILGDGGLEFQEWLKQ